MISSLIKNGIIIKMGFHSLPRLVDDQELACAIGIGYQLMGHVVPTKKERLDDMKEAFLADARSGMDLNNERNQRLVTLIDRYCPTGNCNELLYRFMLYGADKIPEFED